MSISKYYYCSRCQRYPDEINAVYGWATEKQVWGGMDYEVEDIDFGDCNYECGLCGHTLEYLPQEDSNAEILPDVQGEVSSKEDLPEDKKS